MVWVQVKRKSGWQNQISAPPELAAQHLRRLRGLLGKENVRIPNLIEQADQAAEERSA
jgi:RecG-like helicase